MKKLITFFMVVTILGPVLIKNCAFSMDGDEERPFSSPINTVNKEKKPLTRSLIPPTLSISDSSPPSNSLESSPIVSKKLVRAKSCERISGRKKSKLVEKIEQEDNRGESWNNYLVSLGEDESNDHNFLSTSPESSDSRSLSPSLRRFKASSSSNLARGRDNAKEEFSSNVRKSRSLPNSPPLQKFSSSSFPDVRAAPSSRKLKRMRSLSSKEEKIPQLNMESPKAKNNESKNMQGDFDVKDINFILENIEQPLCNYFRSISYLIKNSAPYSGMANTLVYSYPIFTDEKKLFLCMNELKKTSPEHIQVFLEKL